MKLDFSPSASGEQAGIVCYYSTNNYLKCCLIYEEGLKIKVVENRSGCQKRWGKTCRGRPAVSESCHQ
ncbi:hypothetical protein PO124_17160 [Bacillus licheniformis]|nr:hypothetical protein [Bacillus licheniformis]